MPLPVKEEPSYESTKLADSAPRAERYSPSDLKRGLNINAQPVTQGHTPSDHQSEGVSNESSFGVTDEDADLNVQSADRPATGVVKRDQVVRADKESVTAQGNNTSTDMKVEVAGSENVEITNDQEQLVESALKMRRTSRPVKYQSWLFKMSARTLISMIRWGMCGWQ